MRWTPPSWFVDPLVLADLTSPWERAWITRHLAREFDGSGAVVELGTWLGATSLAILDGLERNPSSKHAEVHVFDLFAEDDIESRLGHLPIRGRFRNGESFLPIYRARLGDRVQRVIIHEGDVMLEQWDAGKPIGFVFNDLSKEWDIWNHVKATFYRELRPGSVVVEQDWAHSCTPWIHLWHHRHREVLTPSFHVPYSGSVSFTALDRLPASALEPDRFADYPAEEIDAAYRWAVSLVDEVSQPNVLAARCHLEALFGDIDLASRQCLQQLATAPSQDLLMFTVPEIAQRLHERDARAGLTADC